MKALMTIKAPRGEATINHIPDIDNWWLSTHRLAKKKITPFREDEQRAYHRFTKAALRKRGMAVKAFGNAFIKEHKNGHEKG